MPDHIPSLTVARYGNYFEIQMDKGRGPSTRIAVVYGTLAEAKVLAAAFDLAHSLERLIVIDSHTGDAGVVADLDAADDAHVALVKAGRL